MKLKKSFLIGIIFYLLPAIPFFAYYIDFYFVQVNEMYFWNIFLLSIVPTALIGIVFFIIGLFQKNKTKNDKIIGIAGLVYGILVLIASVIAFSLLLIVLQMW